MSGISRNHGAAAAIVVGFDGSPESERALRWAAQEARYRAAPLRVVLAWEAPSQLAAGAGWVPPDEHAREQAGRAARRRLDDALARIGGDLAGLEVEPRAAEGPATTVLLDLARDAALLVVGSRGHGGFAGLLLGSVSQQCVQHASCPVAVVPPGR